MQVNDKIIYSKSMVGGYDISSGEIILHPHLKKYPKIHDLALSHELGHKFKDKNVIDALYRDLKDNLKLVSYKDYHLFKWDLQNKPKTEFLEYCVKIAYLTGSIILQFIWVPVEIYYSHKYKVWKKKPRKW